MRYARPGRPAPDAKGDRMVGFLFRLETIEGEPAEPPTVSVAVPNWRPGDTIHLGHRTLRVVGTRDDDADLKVEDWPDRSYGIIVCSSNASRQVSLTPEHWREGDLDAIERRLESGGSDKGRVLWAVTYYMLPGRWEVMGALLVHMPQRRSKPILIRRVCLKRDLSIRDKTLVTALLVRGKANGRTGAAWRKNWRTASGTVAVMKGGAENNASSTVSASDLLHGLAQAYERFMSEGRLAVEPVDAYMPIFEALNWAAALDERSQTSAAVTARRIWSWRERVTGGELVAGFRFARHRAHHQWASVLYVSPGRLCLIPFRLRCSSGVGFRELPAGRDDHGKEEYADH